MKPLSVLSLESRDFSGNILEEAEITVRRGHSEGGDLVELFEDPLGNTPKSNPFSATDGSFSVYTYPGPVRVEGTSSAGSGVVLVEVKPNDVITPEQFGAKSGVIVDPFVREMLDDLFDTSATVTAEYAYLLQRTFLDFHRLRVWDDVTYEVSGGLIEFDHDGLTGVDLLAFSYVVDRYNQQIEGATDSGEQVTTSDLDEADSIDPDDNSTALQAWVDALSGGRATGVMQPRTYPISRPLRTMNGVHLVGVPGMTTIRMDSSIMANAEERLRPVVWAGDIDQPARNLRFYGIIADYNWRRLPEANVSDVDANAAAGDTVPVSYDARGGAWAMRYVNGGWMRECEGWDAYKHSIDVSGATDARAWDWTGTPWESVRSADNFTYPDREQMAENFDLFDCRGVGSRDDGITTHNCRNIKLYRCFGGMQRGGFTNNSNGIEIDDASSYVNLFDCSAAWCFSGLEVKGHANALAADHVYVYGTFDAQYCNSGANFRHIGHGRLAGDGDDPEAGEGGPGSSGYVTSPNANDIHFGKIRHENPIRWTQGITRKALQVYAYDRVIGDSVEAIQGEGSSDHYGPPVGDPDFTQSQAAVSFFWDAKNIDIGTVYIEGFEDVPRGVRITNTTSGPIRIGYLRGVNGPKERFVLHTAENARLSIDSYDIERDGSVDPDTIGIGTTFPDQVFIGRGRCVGYENATRAHPENIRHIAIDDGQSILDLRDQDAANKIVNGSWGGGDVPSDGPAGVTTAVFTLRQRTRTSADIEVRETSGDGRVYRNRYTGGAWQGWSVTADYVFDDYETAESTHIGPDQVFLQVRMPDGSVQQYTRDSDGTALETADGANWSPSGKEVLPEAFGAKSGPLVDEIARPIIDAIISAEGGISRSYTNLLHHTVLMFNRMEIWDDVDWSLSSGVVTFDDDDLTGVDLLKFEWVQDWYSQRLAGVDALGDMLAASDLDDAESIDAAENSARIQTWVNWISNDRAVGTMLPQTYPITLPIRVRESVYIRGTPWYSTFRMDDDVGQTDEEIVRPVIWAGDEDEPSHNVRFYGVVADYNYRRVVPRSTVGGSSGPTVPINNGRRGTAWSLGYVKGGWCKDCVGIDAYKHCFDVSGADNRRSGDPFGGDANDPTYLPREQMAENYRLIGCVAYGPGDDAITTHNCRYIYIEDCKTGITRHTYSTNGVGIEIDDASSYVYVKNSSAFWARCGFQIKGHSDALGSDHVYFNGTFNAEYCTNLAFIQHSGHGAELPDDDDEVDDGTGEEDEGVAEKVESPNAISFYVEHMRLEHPVVLTSSSIRKALNCYAVDGLTIGKIEVIRGKGDSDFFGQTGNRHLSAISFYRDAKNVTVNEVVFDGFSDSIDGIRVTNSATGPIRVKFFRSISSFSRYPFRKSGDGALVYLDKYEIHRDGTPASPSRDIITSNLRETFIGDGTSSGYEIINGVGPFVLQNSVPTEAGWSLLGKLDENAGNLNYTGSWSSSVVPSDGPAGVTAAVYTMRKRARTSADIEVRELTGEGRVFRNRFTGGVWLGWELTGYFTDYQENANGSFVQFADGTMIARGTATVDLSAVSANTILTTTFPVAFTDSLAPVFINLTKSLNDYTGDNADNLSALSSIMLRRSGPTTIRYACNGAGDDTEAPILWTSIGRWK